MKGVRLAAWVASLTLVLLMGGMVFAILRGEATRTIVKRVEATQKTCFEAPKRCRKLLRGLNESNSKNRKEGRRQQGPSRPRGGEPSNPPPGNSQPPPPPDDSGGGGGSAAPEPEIRIGPLELDLPDLPLPLPPIHLP